MAKVTRAYLEEMKSFERYDWTAEQRNGFTKFKNENMPSDVIVWN